MKFSKRRGIQVFILNCRYMLMMERTACCCAGMGMDWSDGRWRASWNRCRWDHSHSRPHFLSLCFFPSSYIYLFGMSLLPHHLFVLYFCPCSVSLHLSYVYLLCLLHFTFAIHTLYYFSNAPGLFNQPIFTFIVIHHPISCIPLHNLHLISQIIARCTHLYPKNTK